VNPDASGPDASVTPEHPPGSQVRLARLPAYLRTADERPMLRPPDLVDPEEWGTVTAVRPGDVRAVRFRRGTFLLTIDLLVGPVNGAGVPSAIGPAPGPDADRTR
jgi:hypothetical protein